MKSQIEYTTLLHDEVNDSFILPASLLSSVELGRQIACQGLGSGTILITSLEAWETELTDACKGKYRICGRIAYKNCVLCLRPRNSLISSDVVDPSYQSVVYDGMGGFKRTPWASRFI